MSVQCPNCKREFKDLNALWNHANARRKTDRPWCYDTLVDALQPQERGIFGWLMRVMANPYVAFYIGIFAGIAILTVSSWIGANYICPGTWNYWNGCGQEFPLP